MAILMMGHLVIGGISLPITKIELRDGAIHLFASIKGPTESVFVDTYYILGADGDAIYRSVGDRFVIPPAMEDGILEISIRVNVSDRVAQRSDVTAVVG